MVNGTRYNKYKEIIYYAPFLILLLVELGIHWRITPDFGDDIWFLNATRETGFSIFAWLQERYTTWSSRTLIEAVLIVIVQLPLVVWRLLDSVLITITAIVITKLFEGEKNKNHLGFVVCMLILSLPYTVMSSAGWIASSVNYMWPFAFGVICIYPIKKQAEGRVIRWNERILYSISLLFAVSSEQMCFVVLMSHGSYIIYSIWLKRYRGGKCQISYSVFNFTLSLIGLVYTLACPGNGLRGIQETAQWFPEFVGYSLMKKVELGIAATLKEMFVQENVVFLFLLFLLAIMIWMKHSNWLYRVIGCVPILCVIFFKKLRDVYSGEHLILKVVDKEGMFFGDRIRDVKYYLIFIVLILVCCAILASFYLLLGKSTECIIISGVFITGLATKAVVGFSPTIWSSGGRTGWIMNFAFLSCALMLLSKYKFESRNEKYLLLGVITCIGTAGGLANLMACH